MQPNVRCCTTQKLVIILLTHVLAHFTSLHTHFRSNTPSTYLLCPHTLRTNIAFHHSNLHLHARAHIRTQAYTTQITQLHFHAFVS